MTATMAARSGHAEPPSSAGAETVRGDADVATEGLGETGVGDGEPLAPRSSSRKMPV